MKLPKEVVLAEGTRHTILSDVEESGEFPVQISWVCTVELDTERFLELALSILSNPEPQRLSCPGLNQFVGIFSVTRICEMIEVMAEAAENTPHILVVPTFIYRPSQYNVWADTKEINTYLRRRSIDKSMPLLNLGRSFMARQQSDWVPAGCCFHEYVEGIGLGTRFSSAGMTRYVSRLIRFHSFLDSGMESPLLDQAETAPLAPWLTFQFTEKAETAAILTEYGYNLRKRKAARMEKKVEKKALKRRQSGEKVKAQVKVKAKVVAPVCETEVVEAMETDDLPGQYNVLPVDVSTFRSMVSQVKDLKAEVKGVHEGSADKDKELVKLRRALEGYKKEVRNYKYDLASTERRNKTLERHIMRQSERHHGDMMDYQDDKRNWGIERGELLDRIEEETEKRQIIECQYKVWTDWADKYWSDVAAARE